MSVNDLVLQITKMSPADQFDLAFKVAENVGYVLAAAPAVVILSREKSDRVLSECGYEPATPADDSSSALTGAALARWCYENPNLAALTIESLRIAPPAVGGEELKLLNDIIDASEDFRRGMPADWEGDPLQDAIDNARGFVVGAAQPASPLRGREARCPHDMGFDNELGPLGCRLVTQEMECVCENMYFSERLSAKETSE